MRDGSHDFDFLIGSWQTSYRRLRAPLSGSQEWYECEGTSVVHSFWDGSGNIEDGHLHCPGQYVRSMTLRLYNESSHEWSLYWGTQAAGLAMPPQVGRFDEGGVGQFFARDTFSDKPIIVRYRWTKLHGDRPHFEQAFSPDDGTTWETNWICDYSRSESI